MRKILYVFVFLSLFCFMTNVRALETGITYNKFQGIAYNQKIDGEIKSNIVTFFGLNGRVAYCIEPGIAINERLYDIYYDWNQVNFSSELKDLIEKIGYYGYEYPGHQTSYYYIAAQELIWKAVRPDIDVTWTTEKNLGGNVIDISKEKNEILSLVNNHSMLPSFALTTVSGYIGEEIVLEDNNKVLDYYDISSSKHHEIVKDGNFLKIKLNGEKVDDEVITLTRKYYDKEPLLIYSKGNSQKLASLRISNDKESFFTIKNENFTEEIVEVPNTGVNMKIGECIAMILSGIGMIFGAFKVS